MIKKSKGRSRENIPEQIGYSFSFWNPGVQVAKTNLQHSTHHSYALLCTKIEKYWKLDLESPGHLKGSTSEMHLKYRENHGNPKGPTLEINRWEREQRSDKLSGILDYTTLSHTHRHTHTFTRTHWC